MGEPQTGWTIAMGDGFYFSIERPTPRGLRDLHSDAALNGVFPTKLAAVEEVIAGLEDTRAALSAQLARAKRMRSRLARAALSTPMPDGEGE